MEVMYRAVSVSRMKKHRSVDGRLHSFLSLLRDALSRYIHALAALLSSTSPTLTPDQDVYGPQSRESKPDSSNFPTHYLAGTN